MGMINGRTPGGASDVDIRGPHAGNGPGHKKHAGGHLARGLLDSQVDAAFLDGFPNLSSVLGITFKEFKYIAIYRNGSCNPPAQNQSPAKSRFTWRGWARSTVTSRP